jgi:hypothetical protein
MVDEGQGGAKCGAEVKRPAKRSGKGRSDYEAHEVMVTKLEPTLQTRLRDAWILTVLVYF